MSPTLDFGAGRHMKAQIEHRRVGRLVGNRRIHLREGIALLLQRRQQPGAPGEHAGGNRGLPAAQVPRFRAR